MSQFKLCCIIQQNIHLPYLKVKEYPNVIYNQHITSIGVMLIRFKNRTLETLIQVLAVILISVRDVHPYSVNYQDCSKPTSVSEVNLHEACSKQDEEPIVPKTYTILQKRQHEKAQGHSCKVKRSTFTVYCGAYSHNKLVEAPSIEVPEDVSSHECSSMVNHKRYISHYGTTHVVDIGETIFTASERGVIKAEEGLSLIHI